MIPRKVYVDKSRIMLNYYESLLAVLDVASWRLWPGVVQKKRKKKKIPVVYFVSHQALTLRDRGVKKNLLVPARCKTFDMHAILSGALICSHIFQGHSGMLSYGKVVWSGTFQKFQSLKCHTLRYKINKCPEKVTALWMDYLYSLILRHMDKGGSWSSRDRLYQWRDWFCHLLENKCLQTYCPKQRWLPVK